MPEKKWKHTALPEHPSDELMNRTLQMMNQRLEENRSQPAVQPEPRRFRWIQMGGLAAAVAVLAVFLITQTGETLRPVSFAYQPDMRLSAVSRTDAEGQSDMAALRDELDAALQPANSSIKRTDYQFSDFAMNENSLPMWFASAVYEGQQAVKLTVSNFPTTLHSALKDGEPTRFGSREIRTGVDTATGDFFAVWQHGEYHVQLRTSGAGLSDREKRACIETMLELPLMKD